MELEGLAGIPISPTGHQKDRSTTHMDNLTSVRAQGGRIDFRNTPHGFKPLAASGRLSLGSNQDALLQSILKDCTPDRIKNLKALKFAEMTSDADVNILTPVIAGTQDKAERLLGPKLARADMIPVLPTGYKAGARSSKKEYHCPVEGCDRLYTRKRTLSEHMNVSILVHHTRLLCAF